MIHVDRLLRQMGDRIGFDAGGAPVDLDVADASGPAVVFVAPVADALKRVSDGVVIGSVDRASVERIVAFSLSRPLLESLGVEEITPEDLINAVSESGATWIRVRSA